MKKVLFLLITFTFNIEIILSQRIDPYLDLIYKSKTDPIKSRRLKAGSKEFEFRDKFYKNRKSLNPFFKRMSIDTLDNDPLINVLMQYHGSTSKLTRHGAIIDHRQGEFVMAKIPASTIREISDVEGLVQMELSKPVKYELDVSRNAIGVNLAHNTFPYRGNGIVVGIIDTGIDYDNDAFKTADLSTSRIQYIWDQTIDGDPPTSPRMYLGTEWDNAEINAGGLPHLDNVGHGTRVAGIIAGNGKTSLLQTDFIGIAPEADLVVVKLLVEEKDPIWFPENSFYGNVINGIRYIKEKAKELNKPWVINLSIGGDHGPRNGTSSFEKWMGEHINNSEYRNDGRIIVKSAGNKGYDPNMPNPDQTRKIHAGRIGPASVDLEITDIQPAGNTFAVEIYFPQEDVFSVTIQSPNGYVVGLVEKSDDPRFSNADGGPTLDGWISVSNGGRNANVSQYAERVDDIAIITISDNEAYTGIPGPPADGTWTITMSEGTGEWDAYVYSYHDDAKIYFTDASYTNDNIITEPGNSASILTVGSVNAKNNWVSTSGITNRPEYIIGSISDFSSPGPTRAGIQKPEIYAPGAWISSVFAHETVNPIQSNYAWTAEYYHAAGTSYAAAHITGTAALLLEKWNVERDMDHGMPY